MNVFGFVMIEGVVIHPLKQIIDERGKVMHMLRRDDPLFEKFGEIYFSVAYPGVIKGWHIHKKMTLYYAVLYGMAKLVLFDGRKKSKTFGSIQEIFFGEDNYMLVKIPPLVANGYKAIGVKPTILANCATEPHDPNEIVRIDPFSKEIPYNWDIVMK